MKNPYMYDFCMLRRLTNALWTKKNRKHDKYNASILMTTLQAVFNTMNDVLFSLVHKITISNHTTNHYVIL